MAAPTVYQDVAEGIELEGLGQLFTGKRFWVAQRVPSRNRVLDDIKANGGEVVLLEKNADYLIADHFRRDCPPGSISYEFVEKSIQQGEIRDSEDHRCGPPLGEAREPGAINRPAKGGRATYTAEEDRILYKWVRDAEIAGGLASGNEIYKQLEAKYPRHPWQSWRDRYLKQLRARPPSAFNIPDNAPPSPPSDQSNEQRPSAPSSSRHAKQPVATKVPTKAAKKVSGPGKARTKDDFGLDELAGIFSSEDWEELYAFVDVIDSLAGQERYDASWAEWAEAQANQTAEQWRQYYEKVVRPQWLRDPLWKRVQIKKKIEKKYDGSSAGQSQSYSQQQHQELDEHEEATSTTTTSIEKASQAQKPSESEDEHFEQLLEGGRDNQDAAAYIHYAREQKWSTWNAQPGLDYTGLHKILISQWHSLSEEGKAPYIAMEMANRKRPTAAAVNLSSAEVKLLSSSTVRHESPKYLTELYEKAMKRIRGEDIVEEQVEGESSRPHKRRRSASATPTVDNGAQRAEPVGTQAQPLEISSAEESSVTSHSEVADDPSQEQIRQEMIQALNARQMMVDSDEDEEASEVAESIESDELPETDRLPSLPEGHDDESADDLPSNTPTPRATRQKPSNFDTQAILSSPVREDLSQLPQPPMIQELRAQEDAQQSSSPARHPESDASTTQSLQEFRRSLNEEDIAQLSYPQLNPPLRNTSLSPAPSSSSSTGSGDPDIPLEADEIDEFFNEQYADGHTNDFIVKALRRTRLRPNLATQVLDAWKEGKPLPNQRGIWSVEDDDAVESGDGVALAKLERKHTLDGWGGITERLMFLEAQRTR
ncbi:Nn.00g085390.m01.CDS01 [Neocucurbitaria sp. VM-36]